MYYIELMIFNLWGFMISIFMALFFWGGGLDSLHIHVHDAHVACINSHNIILMIISVRGKWILKMEIFFKGCILMTACNKL